MTADVRRAHSLIEIWHLFWTGSDVYVKGRLALALGLTIASAVITAISPIALKYAIDGFTQRSGNGFYIFLFVGLYVLGLWLARNLTELRVLVHGQADRRLNRSLSDRLFNHILHLPLRFHLDRQTGAINETLTNGLFGYQLVLQVGVYTVLPVLVQLAVVATVLVHLKQPIFLALFMVAVVLYAVTFGYGAVRITKAARAASDAQVEARGVMTDAIINFETVKFFTAEPVVREKVDAAQGAPNFQWLRFYKSRTRNGLAVAASLRDLPRRHGGVCGARSVSGADDHRGFRSRQHLPTAACSTTRDRGVRVTADSRKASRFFRRCWNCSERRQSRRPALLREHCCGGVDARRARVRERPRCVSSGSFGSARCELYGAAGKDGRNCGGQRPRQVHNRESAGSIAGSRRWSHHSRRRSDRAVAAARSSPGDCRSPSGHGAVQ